MRGNEVRAHRRAWILCALLAVAAVAGLAYLVATTGTDDDVVSEPVSATIAEPNDDGDDAATNDPSGSSAADAGGGGGDHADDPGGQGDRPAQGQPPPGTEASGESAGADPVGKQPPAGASAEGPGSKQTDFELGSQPPQENPDYTGKPTQLEPDEPPGRPPDDPSEDLGVPGADGNNEPPGE